MSEKKYLVDSNAFIEPFERYYAFGFASKFWDQLLKYIEEGRIVILDLVRIECTRKDNDLKKWFEVVDDKKDITYRKEQYVSNYGLILQHLQDSPYYTDVAVKKWAESGIADAWLIAVAKAEGFTLVTIEAAQGNLNKNQPTSKPKIPNVAKDFDVEVIDLFAMMHELEFKLA